MTPVEIAAAKAKLDELIDGTEIQTAGWIPGKDWSGTPFQLTCSPEIMPLVS